MSSNPFVKPEEQAAHEACRAAIERVQRRAALEELAALPVRADLEAEATRMMQARAKAMAGRPGVDYFPREICPCGCNEPTWWDADRQRLRAGHDGLRPYASTDVYQEPAQRMPRKPAEPTQLSLDELARHIRARRSMGERDDD